MSNERAAEQKRDTGPMPSPALPGGTTPVRRLRRRNPWRLAIAALAAVTLIIGVIYLTRPPDPMQDQRPVEVVQLFVAAIEARDVTEMLRYVEPTMIRREISPEVRAYMEYAETIRFENPGFTLLDNNGRLAHVRLTATLRYRVNLGSTVKAGTQPVDTTVELTRLEGAWYLRGVRLPQL